MDVITAYKTAKSDGYGLLLRIRSDEAIDPELTTVDYTEANDIEVLTYSYELGELIEMYESDGIHYAFYKVLAESVVATATQAIRDKALTLETENAMLTDNETLAENQLTIMSALADIADMVLPTDTTAETEV